MPESVVTKNTPVSLALVLVMLGGLASGIWFAAGLAQGLDRLSVDTDHHFELVERSMTSIEASLDEIAEAQKNRLTLEQFGTFKRELKMLNPELKFPDD